MEDIGTRKDFMDFFGACISATNFYYSAVQMFLYYDRYNLIYGWEKGLC
jgi:hypothetical protein